MEAWSYPFDVMESSEDIASTVKQSWKHRLRAFLMKLQILKISKIYLGMMMMGYWEEAWKCLIAGGSQSEWWVSIADNLPPAEPEKGQGSSSIKSSDFVYKHFSRIDK